MKTSEIVNGIVFAAFDSEAAIVLIGSINAMTNMREACNLTWAHLARRLCLCLCA